MANRDDIIQAIRNADAAGDSASVRKLGAFLKSIPASNKPAAEIYDPTEGMSGGEKFLAGMGKGFVDVGRGVGQLARHVLPDKAADAIGSPTQADIDEAKRLDAPLMRTGAGVTGNVAGTIAAAIPTVFIPGAATFGGAAAVGAGLGALQPVASDESRLKNTVIGGVAGTAGVVAGRAGAALYKGGKALIEPLTQAGRQKIAGRTLERFGVQASDLANATSQPTVTGARTTLAEQITRPEGAAGAARLQDSLRAADPEVAGKFAAREVENNAARVAKLKELAGEGGQRNTDQMLRDQTAKVLYDKAFSYRIDPAKLSAAERGEMTKIFRMPAIKNAMKAGADNLANEGLTQVPQTSIRAMHAAKLALDDAISTAGTSASDVNKAMSMKMARDRLVTFMERHSSDHYADARRLYAEMSKPINQADVAAEVLKKGTANTGDLAGNPRLMPNSLTGAVKDEGQLMKNATGRNLGTKLSDLLEPKQLAALKGVVGEVDRSAAVARAGNGPGSATAQRLSGQNVLSQLIGPTGLPQSWAESTLLNTLMRPVQFAYSGVAEPKLQITLADLLLNPDKARAALAAATPAQASKLKIVLSNPKLQQAARAATPAIALDNRQ